MMKRYVVKEVEAQAMQFDEYCKYKGYDMSMTPCPLPGFLVSYPGGYDLWMSEKAFLSQSICSKLNQDDLILSQEVTVKDNICTINMCLKNGHTLRTAVYVDHYDSLDQAISECSEQLNDILSECLRFMSSYCDIQSRP